MMLKLEINNVTYDEVMILVRGDNGSKGKPGNGIITTTDYTALSNIVAAKITKTDIHSLIFDINKNGYLTVTDLSPISLYLSNKATFSDLNNV